MASVAAVEADLQRPRLPDNLGEPGLERTGFIGPKDAPLPDLPDESEDVVDGEEAHSGQDQLNGNVNSEDGGAQEDLFGEQSNDEEPNQRRRLDDQELDSGDDLDRSDRVGVDEDVNVAEEEEEEAGQESYLEAEIARHAIPDPSDGELYLLKVPRFLSIDPKAWSPETFQPPVMEHHSKAIASATFSPFSTATTTLRWRRSPSQHNTFQSNARVLRWSDGSLTLQLASNPESQYELPGNALAFPQQNTLKPTPTSVTARKGNRTQSTKYNQQQDSFTYLCAPAPAASLIRVTNKITTGLSVLPSAEVSDDALERLQTSLAAATRGNRAVEPGQAGGIGVISIHEDPELAKKKAEVAEKEKLRAQRRREAQEQRERDRANRVLGRSGLRTAGGLTAAGLEDDEMGLGLGRPRGPRGPKKRRARRDEYSEDEEEGYGGRGRTREDEYDEEDDFVARSDEEDEVVEGDDDEDIDEGIDLGRKSPKRPRESRDEGEDAGGAAEVIQGPEEKVKTAPDGEEDGEGEVDEDMIVSRSKRRKVVEEDEEE